MTERGSKLRRIEPWCCSALRPRRSCPGTRWRPTDRCQARCLDGPTDDALGRRRRPVVPTRGVRGCLHRATRSRPRYLACQRLWLVNRPAARRRGSGLRVATNRGATSRRRPFSIAMNCTNPYQSGLWIIVPAHTFRRTVAVGPDRRAFVVSGRQLFGVHASRRRAEHCPSWIPRSLDRNRRRSLWPTHG